MEDLRRAWQVYERAMLAERRWASVRSQERGRSIYRSFADYLTREGYPLTIRALSAERVRDFSLWLRDGRRGHTIAVSSVSNYLEQLKAWAHWLADEYPEHFPAGQPLGRVKYIKRPKLKVEVLTRQQIKALLHEAAQGKNPKRDTAVLYLLLDTGIRVEELVTLSEKSVNFEYLPGQAEVKVLGKGSKRRTVYLGPGSIRALQTYLHSNPRKGGRPLSQNPSLFLSYDGATLTTDGVRRWMKRIGTRADVNDLHPHLFRHTFATEYLRNHRGDLEGLRRLLGHSRIETTMIYLHFVEQDLASGHAKGSPVAAWGLTGKVAR